MTEPTTEAVLRLAAETIEWTYGFVADEARQTWSRGTSKALDAIATALGGPAIEAEARADALREAAALDRFDGPDCGVDGCQRERGHIGDHRSSEAEPPALDVERLATAVGALDWEPFWTETDRDADGMIEVTFDHARFAERLAAEYARLAREASE